MASPTILPVIAPRQPKPKSLNDPKLHETLPVVQPKHPKTNHARPKNYSRLTAAEWEEIRDILRPGLPFNIFHHNASSNNVTKNSTLPYSPQHHQSLKVLAVLLAVLLLSFLALCLRFCWDNRRRKGYSPAPSNPPEDQKKDDDDVIAEVVNRREQMPAKPSNSQTSQKSLYYSPHKPQSNYDSTKSSSAKITPKTSTNNKPVNKEPSKTTKKSDNVKFATEAFEPSPVNRDPSLLLSKKATQSPSSPAIYSFTTPATCPLNEGRPLKLIPVENLVIPRTFNDALEKAFPDMVNSAPKVDLDTVLSLNRLERSQSKPNLVLKPIPSDMKMHISAEPDIPEEIPQFPLSHARPPPLLPFQREDLNEEQQEEERQKFLRACWKTEMRRRRSLCSISNNEDLVDSNLYNSIVHSAECHYYARKVKSLPTMRSNSEEFPKLRPPAAYSTDALGLSPMWSPPSLGHHSGPETGLRSRSSSANSNFQDDWHHLRKSMSLSTKTFSVPEEANIHPSFTSIWSTIASENATEPNPPENDIDTEDELQFKITSPEKNFNLEVFKEKHEKNIIEIPTITTSHALQETINFIAEERDDDPGDILSETKFERKKSLSCIDFILEAAKSSPNGSPAPTKPDRKASNESMSLESDKIPSEIFAVIGKPKMSATSLDSLLEAEYSISRLFDKSPSSFWDRIDNRDYQIIRGGSGIVSRGAVDPGKSSDITATIHKGNKTLSPNKISPNNLLNTKKENVKSPAVGKH